MPALTPEGQRQVNALAQQFQVSPDAVMTLLHALIVGQGTMAQFQHAELGGSGQWMRGGMTMVGDMFNHALKARVDGLCAALSSLLDTAIVPPPQERVSVRLFTEPSGAASGAWWPADFGSPSMTGAQNRMRYAYFAAARRLAIDLDGQIAVYDTLDHNIAGVSQQQGAGTTVTFTSQHGVVAVTQLPLLSDPQAAPKRPPVPEAPGGTDVLGTIERLAQLHRQGILSDQEFASKKAELLERL